MTMSRDTEKNYLRYADLLQSNDRRIRVYCFRWAKNDDEADELEQEVRIALWLKLDGCTAEDGLRQRRWLYRVMRSAIVDYWRRHRSVQTVSVDSVAGIAAPDDTSASEQLHELMAYLGSQDNLIVDLSLQGLSSAEMAARLGMSTESVRKRLYRAVEQMKAIKKRIYG